jgi:hypothetical protein
MNLLIVHLQYSDSNLILEETLAFFDYLKKLL